MSHGQKNAAMIYSADAMWRGTAGSRLDQGAVVVEDDAIVWVGAADEIPREYEDAPRQHFAGATLMPGLIESHAHLAYDGGEGTKKRSFSRSPAALMAVMIASARELLSVGVTTVRDLGTRDNLSIEVRDVIDEGIVPGPRALVSGAQITTTGGHTWQNHGRADTPDELRRLVRSHHKAGVDLIKVNATGGFMTAGSEPRFAQFSADEFEVIVEEAHRLGKKVAAHAHGSEGIAIAVRAGVDTLEHCTFVGEGGAILPDPALIDEIVERGIHVCATATWNFPQFIRANPEFVPPVKLMYDRGVKLIAGNDAGIDGVPHRNYVGGLETSVILGVPVEQVLIGATSLAAEALGLSATTGVLEAGASADLIVVAGDPLTDISTLRELRLVVTRGKRFEPDAIEVSPPDPDLARALAADAQRSKVGTR